MRTRNKNSYISDFFETPNIQNSYWAGFIAGDGHITPDRKKISVKLKRTDRCHLETFARHVGVGRLYDYERRDSRTNRIYYSSEILITNVKLVEDLIKNWNFGHSQKTYNLQPPQGLSDDLSWAYIAGLLDADGSYAVKHSRPSLNMLATLPVLEWMLDKTEELVGRRAAIRYRGGGQSEAEYHGNQAIEIRKRIHSLDVDFLGRKYDDWERKGASLHVTGPRHGTRNMYEVHKCRCQECSVFYSSFMKAQYEKRKAKKKADGIIDK